MRILFDPAVYDLRNKGNVALLQVAVNRIKKLWPNATLEVITTGSYLLKLYCPNAFPVSPYNEFGWTAHQGISNKVLRNVPSPILRGLFELREELWRSQPKLSSKLVLGKSGVPANEDASSQENLTDYESLGKEDGKNDGAGSESVLGSDLFVATGAQYMSDACKQDALRVLDRMETAAQHNIPTAMLGQGIGPINDPELCVRAKAVYPLIDYIFVREKRVAPGLLGSFGVDPARVIFTGDDAIEMAYEARTGPSGTNIGLGLRASYYTEVESKHVQIIRDVVQHSAAKYNATLVALPISHSAHELDPRLIREVLAGYKKVKMSRWRFESPLEIIKDTGQCRLVIAGTYHTAIFALSQGIPAIGLAKSVMYMDKFLGLVDQFGPGCQVVYLDDPNMREKLEQAINIAWDSADQVKPQLLDAARYQIQCGQAAYKLLFQYIESREMGQ
jgi:polysaccharide pyruvyl transferase WcaK-like protein